MQHSFPWHAQPLGDVITRLSTNGKLGLTTTDVTQRQQQYGPNELVHAPKQPWWKHAAREACEELTEPTILLLLVIGVVYGLLGNPRDALAILALLLLVLCIEVGTEQRAKGAIAALSRLAALTASVIRHGSLQTIPAEQLVPGDLVLLRAGQRVPADLRLGESTGLHLNEASLTGESLPVSKGADVHLPAETLLAERTTMAFAGTVVTAGHSWGIVVATGMNTELGQITKLAASASKPRTPLQRAMRHLAGWLLWVALGFSLVIPLVGWLFGQAPREMILSGLTLAFATIPEELPLLITIVLGLGGYRLARRHAIAKRLQTVETLGAVTVIATDKTGTLTQNAMSVQEVFTEQQTRALDLLQAAAPTDAVWLLFTVAVLANDAVWLSEQGDAPSSGDPTETALLSAAEQVGLSVAQIRTHLQSCCTWPFDEQRKRLTVVSAQEGGFCVATKGAPEVLLAGCDHQRLGGEQVHLTTEERARCLAEASRMASAGLRVLGFATKSCEALPLSREEAETDQVFLGFVGLSDPPRPEAASAVSLLRTAGLRVLMLTGDHPRTAEAIARSVGIDGQGGVTGTEIAHFSSTELHQTVQEVSLYARITPAQKLRIVQALQEQGEMVLVTGDGVNDVPALTAAAVGVAMGQTGTDPAKEAADLVLANDNFATLAEAVREGRKLYSNLWKAVRYYLAVKVALVSIAAISILLGLPLAFTPLQIILMEVFMDLGASISFTAEQAEATIMRQPPRPSHQLFLNRRLLRGIFGGGFSLTAAVIVVYVWEYQHHLGGTHAQTAAFATWMVGHVLLAMHMRSDQEPVLHLGFWSNRAFLVWAIGAVLFLWGVITLPWAHSLAQTTFLNGQDWLVVLAAALLAPAWMEIGKWWRWRKQK